MGSKNKISRRHLLAATGTLALGYGITNQSLASEIDATLAQNELQLLVLNSSSVVRVEYEFAISGDIIKTVDTGGLFSPSVVTKDADDQISNPDEYDGKLVRGATQGGVDAYVFSGQLESFDSTNCGQFNVWLNGERQSACAMNREYPKGIPGDGTSLPNHIVIFGGGGSNVIYYEFSVSGEIEPSSESGGAPIADRYVSFNDDTPGREGDRISGQTARGAVAGGGDAYRFSGDIVSFEIDGGAQVYLNGEQVNPDDLGSDDGADDPSEAIEFIDCTTARVVGDYQEVMIYWSGYVPGIVTNLDSVGEVSGDTVIGLADLYGEDSDFENHVVLNSVELYKEKSFDGNPDIQKRNPNREACDERARPQKPSLSIEQITRTGQSTYDVTFGYTNPNDIVIFATNNFETGHSLDSPPDRLQPGQHTFTVTWQPERDDERLLWDFYPSGYGGQETVSVATPTHEEVREQWMWTVDELRNSIDEFAPSDAEVVSETNSSQTIRLSNGRTGATLTVYDDGTVTYENEDGWWDVDITREELVRSTEDVANAQSMATPQSAAVSNSAVQSIDQAGDTYTITIAVDSQGFGQSPGLLQLVLEAVAPTLVSYIISLLPNSGSYSDFIISILRSIGTALITGILAQSATITTERTTETESETTTKTTETTDEPAEDPTTTTATETPAAPTTETTTPTTTTETPTTTTTTESTTTTSEVDQEEEETTVSNYLLDLFFLP